MANIRLSEESCCVHTTSAVCEGRPLVLACLLSFGLCGYCDYLPQLNDSEVSFSRIMNLSDIGCHLSNSFTSEYLKRHLLQMHVIKHPLDNVGLSSRTPTGWLQASKLFINRLPPPPQGPRWRATARGWWSSRWSSPSSTWSGTTPWASSGSASSSSPFSRWPSPAPSSPTTSRGIHSCICSFFLPSER